VPKCALPITFWPLTASIAMEVRNNLPMSQHKSFLEQIHWIELFYGMSDVWFGRDAVYSKIRLPVKILMRWAKVNCFSDQNLFDNANKNSFKLLFGIPIRKADDFASYLWRDLAFRVAENFWANKFLNYCRWHSTMTI
jgi:hypothetical protein